MKSTNPVSFVVGKTYFVENYHNLMQEPDASLSNTILPLFN